ncbi:MAG: hypothetical protein OXK74_10330, partial [Gemmatimonadota bacterium]|nr:hypothetical protein [Gemmatimonadota bacterium]
MARFPKIRVMISRSVFSAMFFGSLRRCLEGGSAMKDLNLLAVMDRYHSDEKWGPRIMADSRESRHLQRQ